MDAGEIKKKYGDKLSLWGTVDNQFVLPQGTPDEVEEEVKLRIQQCASRGWIPDHTHASGPTADEAGKHGSLLRRREEIRKLSDHQLTEGHHESSH